MADGYVFYRSFYDAIKALPGEQAKAVLIAVSEYALDGILPGGSDPVVTMAFTLIKPQIDANSARREAGKAGAEKRWKSHSKAMASDSKAMANDSKQVATEWQPVAKDKVKDKVKVKEKEKEKDKDKDVIGTEPETAFAPETPPIITLPLNDGSEYPISQNEFNEWLMLYPAVDVLAELRKMRGWLQANVAKRKTKKGIQRFVVNWLSREQDKPHTEMKTAPRNEENPFLRMLKESEANDGTGNTEDSISFEGGIPDVLPGFDGW